MNAKHLALAAMAALFSCRVASAKTVHFNDCEITDWSTVGLAASDTAQLNANTTAYVNDTASLLVVSNLAQVTLSGYDTSKIVFTVPEGQTWSVGSYIRSGNGIAASGHLVKRGKGTLNLLQNAQEAPYNCNITVEEGALKMPANLTLNSKCTYTGVIAVSNGATFYAPGFSDASGTWNWYARGFTGDGIITNGGTYSVNVGLAVNSKSWAWDGKTYDFGGDFRGAFTFATGQMRQFFSGTNSTFTTFGMKGDDGTYSAGQGTVGVRKFGNSGEPSSIGTSSYVRWAGGGGLLYLGDGETTDKELQFQEGGHPFIDGGAHGGLVLTTALENGYKANHTKYDKTLVLMGSNTEHCVIAGNVPGWKYSSVPYTFHIVKKGSGVWRLDNASSTMTGTIAVEEGVLGFGRLLEKGQLSSFGYATGEAAAEVAISLGTSETEGGIGQYSSASGASRSTTRPISLVGDGRIVNNTTNFLGVGMISVTNSSGATLTLDGSGTNSVAYSLKDGAGPLSLVKEGSGTWRLSGTNTFTGALDVKAGTLVFSSPTNYVWYKWVVRGLCGTNGKYFWMSELGLYDSDNACITGGLKAGANYAVLSPGEVAVARSPSAIGNTSGTIESLFNGDNTPWKGSITETPLVDDESTWIEILMRMPANAQTVKSWDMAGGYYSGDNTNQYVSSCVLMGSVDGVHFDMLSDLSGLSYNGYRFWAGAGVAVNADNCAVHSGGFLLDKTAPTEAFPMPTNALVSVAAGATLRAEGRRPTLSRLKISALGGGTIDGFAFAEHGELHVVDVSNGSVTLPVTFANAEGIANIRNWTLYVNGSATPSKMSIDENGGVLRLLPPGFMLLFR